MIYKNLDGPHIKTVKNETVLYNCKKCKVAKRVEYPRKNKQGYIVTAGIWITYINPHEKIIEYGGDVENGLCFNCGEMMKYSAVKGYLNPDIKCNGKCMSARNGNCECSCGGKNHGLNW